MGTAEEKRVASWYDTLSDSYYELYTEEQSAKHSLVLDFLKMTRFTTLLDVGCGRGTFLRRAVHLYDYAVGVDLSSNMLVLAKREKPSAADLVRATSSMLPFRPESVDGVVSISAVSASKDFQRVVSELERIGTRDSVKVITVLKSPNNRNPFRIPDATSRTDISKIETLYLLNVPKMPQLVTESTRPIGEFKNKTRSMVSANRMPGCSHQWRGKGQMARCIRCGKLKSDFRKEKHEQKMMQREEAELAQQ